MKKFATFFKNLACIKQKLNLSTDLEKKIYLSARYAQDYPPMFLSHFLSSTRINKVLVQSFSRSLKPLKGGQWVTNKEFGSEILALHRNLPTLVLKGP